jgi:hypothetical protein
MAPCQVAPPIYRGAQSLAKVEWAVTSTPGIGRIPTHPGIWCFGRQQVEGLSLRSQGGQMATSVAISDSYASALGSWRHDKARVGHLLETRLPRADAVEGFRGALPHKRLISPDLGFGQPGGAVIFLPTGWLGRANLPPCYCLGPTVWVAGAWLSSPRNTWEFLGDDSHAPATRTVATSRPPGRGQTRPGEAYSI